jgi:tetratricopeptide (TPR) repeat protein
MQTVQTFTGTGRNPCPLPTTGNVLSYDGMLLDSGTRSAAPSSIPYILHPRATAILESRPVLRWNDTGASSYTVEIWQGGDKVWQETNATNDSLEYPRDAQALQSATDYLLVVTDNDTGKSSRSDPNKGLGFQVVAAEQRAEIEAQQGAISNLAELDSAAQKMALALYLNQIDINGRGLWGEATALFEEVSKVQPNAPAVPLHLGSSLAKMKLWTEAQSAYELALTQAQTLNDLESQADAYAALWRITGNKVNYDQAVNLYEQIGADDKVASLQH